MKKIQKKYKIIASGITLTALTAASVAIPLAMQEKTKEINLFNRNFASREELLEYALKNSKYIDKNDQGVYWMLNDRGEKTFTSHESLRKYIYNKISSAKIRHYKDIDAKNISSIDGSVMSSALIDMNSSVNSSEQRFYRGINDTIYNDKKDAIDSYFQYHKVFMYDNITFRTSEDLKKYLFKNYDSNSAFKGVKGKYNISSPDEITSSFFDFNNKDDLKNARKFVEQTSTKMIGFKNSNGGFNYINTNDIISDTLNNNFWNNLSIDSINAIKLKSNNGNGLWITDTKKSDEHNFFGDFFTKTKTNEIELITSKGKWTETGDDLDYSRFKKIKNASKIGNFFNVINSLVAYADVDMNDKDAFKVVSQIKTVFDVPRYKKILGELTAKYDSKKINNIVTKLKNVSLELYENKRFNPLYEIPLLYLKTLSSAQEMNLKNKELKILKDFFAKVMGDYQESMETILPKESLVDSEGKKINLKYLFGINDVSYDLNSTPEAAMYKLAESTEFIEGISHYLGAITNKLSNGGAASFYVRGIEGEKNQRMWEVLSGSAKQYEKSKDKAKDLQEDLGRKLTNKQVTLFLNILSVNDQLLKAKEKMEAENDWKEFKEILKEFKGYSPKRLGELLKADPKWAKQQIGDKAVELDKLRKIYAKGNFNLEKDNLTTIERKIKTRTLREKYSKEFNEKIENSDSIPKSVKKKVKIDLQEINSQKADERRINRFKKAKRTSQMVSATQNTVNGIIEVNNLVEQIRSDDAYGALKTVSKLFNTASEFMGAIPVAGAAFQVVGFAFDIASEAVGKKKQQIFTFSTSEDNAKKFYWDGGESTVRFWGLWTKKESGIEDMDIASPIKIWNGTNRDGYYYNGKFYKDVSLLKKQALLDFANGDNEALILNGKDPKISRAFTYNKIEANKQLKRGTKVFNTKEELSKEIIPDDLGSKIDQSYLKLNKYIKSAQFALIGGKISQFNPTSIHDKIEIKKYNIREFLKKIKATIVVQLPEIINGLPYDQGSGNLDSIIKRNAYKIPGSAIYKAGKVVRIKDYKSYNYIMVNLNEQVQEGKNKKFKYTSPASAIGDIKKVFLKTIDVDSIYALKSNSLNVNRFSNLETIKEYKLFKAMGIGGQIKFFKEYTDAFKWIISREQMDLKTIISKGLTKKLMFNNVVFKDEVELINYLDGLISKQGGK